MQPVKWGVVGISSHFLRHILEPMQRSHAVDLVAISSRDVRKVESTAEKFGIPRAYSSYDELLVDPSIEAVYVPLPNSLHAFWIQRATEAGKHVLCEKPLALNALQAMQSFQYAQRHRVRLMEGIMYRFHPQWTKAIEVIRSGGIGEVQCLYVHLSYVLTDPLNIRNRADLGGGALLDIGCYAVSISRLLLQGEPKRVVCVQHRDPALNTDILSTAILDFGGRRAALTVGTQTFSDQQVVLHGTRGRLIVEKVQVPENLPAALVLHDSSGVHEIAVEAADHYQLELEAFCEGVRKNGPLSISPEESINNQKVIDALLQSEETGSWVSLQ